MLTGEMKSGPVRQLSLVAIEPRGHLAHHQQ